MDFRKAALIVIVILGAAGLLSILLATPWGIGVSPDSIRYIVAAENLADGKGYSLGALEGTDAAVTHWPPLYSGLLAGLGKTGLGVRLAARGLNAVLLAANLLILGLALYPYVNNRRSTFFWFGLLLTLLLVSPAVYQVHLMAWSEPLFILLTMSGLLLLSWFLDTRRAYLLLLSAFIAALSLLTRFAGVVLIFSGGLGILLISRSPWLRRLVEAGIYGLIGLAPFAVWLAFTYQSTGELTSRVFSYHPIGGFQLSQALTTLAAWLAVPLTAPQWLKVLLVGTFFTALGLILYLGVKNNSEASQATATQSLRRIPNMVKLVFLFVVTYPLFLIVSFSFFDANILFDERMFSPMFVACLVLVGFALRALQGSLLDRPWAWAILALSGLLICAGYFMSWRGLVGRSYQEGIGFHNRGWQESPTLAGIEDLPQSTVLYSNAPDGIYFHTGRAALSLPRKVFSLDQTRNENYAAELDQMRSQLIQQNGLVVYFNAVYRPTLPAPEELVQVLGLRQVSLFADGAIFAPQSP